MSGKIVVDFFSFSLLLFRNIPPILQELLVWVFKLPVLLDSLDHYECQKFRWDKDRFGNIWNVVHV